MCLDIAAQNGRLMTVAQLVGVRGQVDVNAVNKHGNSALHYATFYRFHEIAKVRLERIILQNYMIKTYVCYIKRLEKSMDVFSC